VRIANVCCVLAMVACGHQREQDPALGSGFVDHFDRAELGSNYRNTGGPYRIADGKLVFAHAHNQPLWLKRRLPHDVRIELDAMSRSSEGDLKVEAFGDGYRHESEQAVKQDLIYTASGYVFIFGGWRNTHSALVRQNEHAWQRDPALPQRTSPRVEPGRTYHWVIERRGNHLDWTIDGAPFLSWDDPEPLDGDHFAFDGWDTECVFDNLSITAL